MASEVSVGYLSRCAVVCLCAVVSPLYMDLLLMILATFDQQRSETVRGESPEINDSWDFRLQCFWVNKIVPCSAWACLDWKPSLCLACLHSIRFLHRCNLVACYRSGQLPSHASACVQVTFVIPSNVLDHRVTRNALLWYVVIIVVLIFTVLCM